MEMPIGDIVDRFAICKLKSERLLIDNSDEINLLTLEIQKYENISEYVDKLYEINGKIWDLESDIRKGNEDLLGLEEVGRRAIKIREYNGIRVGYKNEINSYYNEGFIEVKMNHGSEKEVSVIITLTTVPERLLNEKEDGLKLVLKNLCEQEDDDYEVHFNVPKTYNVTKQEYIIPSWLNGYKLKYKHLKVFRTEDFGPPTKFIPALQRVTNLETILIVVDDDLVYHPKMVKEHRKYQNQFTDCVIGYDGRGSEIPIYNDIRDSWVVCVTHPRETHSLQHYKSVSYKAKLFNQNFYDFYFKRTFSDDVLVSSYFRKSGIKMYVVPYEKEIPLYETRESWDIHQGVTSFPVLRYASSVENTGCNHPWMLSIQPKFYESPLLGVGDDEVKIKTKSYQTDKFNHGYMLEYEKRFSKLENALNILEIGVYQGESLKYLKDYFQSATIHGIDINDCSEYESDRIKIYKLNQENRDELIDFIKETNLEFDLIIDDGGHTMKQQQTTLGVLFNILKSKGLYVIEDLHTSDKSPWMNDEDEISTLNMLKTLKNSNVLISNYIQDNEKNNILNNIDSIEIWSSSDDFSRSITSFLYKK
jgi:hypothetical protein